MDNKRRVMLLVIFILAAIGIGLIVYFLIFYKFGGNQPAAGPGAASTTVERITNQAPSANAGVLANPLETQQNIANEDVGQVARSFTERFGTYSNQLGSDQFDDLKFFATAKMIAAAEAQIKQILGDQKDYKTSRVIISQAVSSNVLFLDKAGGRASVLVGIRRLEQVNNDSPKITNQNLKLDLVMSGKRWKVDAVTWQ